MTENIAVDRLLQDLKSAHNYLFQTMEGVTEKIAEFQPGGKANPIAGTYAHLVFSEDFFTQFFLQGQKPLFETTWKDKTGISELQPTEWQEAYPKWLKTVKVDITLSRPYVEAVFEASEKYLSSLTDQDLLKTVDMSSFGMGSRTVGEVVGAMMIGHTNNIMGEISVLKGIQGLKGYPF